MFYTLQQLVIKSVNYNELQYQNTYVLSKK